jgi:hypothetical protein
MCLNFAIQVLPVVVANKTEIQRCFSYVTRLNLWDFPTIGAFEHWQTAMVQPASAATSIPTDAHALLAPE